MDIRELIQIFSAGITRFLSSWNIRYFRWLWRKILWLGNPWSILNFSVYVIFLVDLRISTDSIWHWMWLRISETWIVWIQIICGNPWSALLVRIHYSLAVFIDWRINHCDNRLLKRIEQSWRGWCSDLPPKLTQTKNKLKY